LLLWQSHPWRTRGSLTLSRMFSGIKPNESSLNESNAYIFPAPTLSCWKRCWTKNQISQALFQFQNKRLNVRIFILSLWISLWNVSFHHIELLLSIPPFVASKSWSTRVKSQKKKWILSKWITFPFEPSQLKSVLSSTFLHFLVSHKSLIYRGWKK
jgi:membrane associated rhomboid family serine protease